MTALTMIPTRALSCFLFHSLRFDRLATLANYLSCGPLQPVVYHKGRVPVVASAMEGITRVSCIRPYLYNSPSQASSEDSRREHQNTSPLKTNLSSSIALQFAYTRTAIGGFYALPCLLFIVSLNVKKKFVRLYRKVGICILI